VPVVPSCLLEPIWVEFHEAIGGDRPEYHPDHPLGCHRRRIPDRVVFEHVIDALVHGSGYERIATATCSDRTIRRRVQEWAQAGVGEWVHAVALHAYDMIIGLDLADISVDGCITKAPCGGDKAGPSPVDRRKGGLKRSVATEGNGIPLGLISAGANRNDSPLLRPTLQAAIDQVGPLPEQVTSHLDRGYDNRPSRELLAIGVVPCQRGGGLSPATPDRTAVRSVMADGRREPGVVRGRRLPLLYFAAVHTKKGHFPIMGCGL
jgi:hypothetical protein